MKTIVVNGQLVDDSKMVTAESIRSIQNQGASIRFLSKWINFSYYDICGEQFVRGGILYTVHLKMNLNFWK